MKIVVKNSVELFLGMNLCLKIQIWKIDFGLIIINDYLSIYNAKFCREKLMQKRVENT